MQPFSFNSRVAKLVPINGTHDFLGNSANLFSLLGVIGDHEQKIKNNKEFTDKINNFCNENNLTFEDLLKMAYLLDSNYKLGDKKTVEKAPHMLLENESPNDILNNKFWNENLNKLNEEITNILEKPSNDIGGIILKKINTPYNIISTITRKIAWESGKNTVVVNSGFFENKDQIYMRSTKNAEPMIQRGKSLGFKCGGKKEVLGAIVPKDKSESFVQEMLEFLKIL